MCSHFVFNTNYQSHFHVLIFTLQYQIMCDKIKRMVSIVTMVFMFIYNFYGIGLCYLQSLYVVLLHI